MPSGVRDIINEIEQTERTGQIKPTSVAGMYSITPLWSGCGCLRLGYLGIGVNRLIMIRYFYD
jgi:hypothetical protein